MSVDACHETVAVVAAVATCASPDGCDGGVESPGGGGGFGAQLAVGAEIDTAGERLPARS